MTLSTVDPGSKACWESNSCKEQAVIGSLSFVCLLCVYRVLMCTLVFLGLQIHSSLCWPMEYMVRDPNDTTS